MSGRPEKTVFHQSVMGASHRRKGICCQDASGSFVSDGGDIRIAAVADGHGDPTCLRSDRGSALAVSVVMDCLREFGEYYSSLEMIESEDRPHMEDPDCLRQLTDAVVSRWAAAVKEDIAELPLSEEEYGRAGAFEERYRQGDYLERVYGCTLVAALETGSYRLLLQQGDGRCDILRETGEIEQPVPEDERCYGNVTTSMSDEDAGRGIRSVLLPADDPGVIGCLLSTDGVENGFYEDEEILQFYLDVGSALLEAPEGEYPSVLEPLLSDVSIHGNGDDVSLAGILSMERLKASEQTMEDVVRKNRLDGAIAQVESKLVSMERKLEILQGRVRNVSPEGKEDAMKEYMDYRIQYNKVKAKAEELSEEK